MKRTHPRRCVGRRKDDIQWRREDNITVAEWWRKEEENKTTLVVVVEEEEEEEKEGRQHNCGSWMEKEPEN